MAANALTAALAAWKRVVGARHVLDQPHLLRHYQTATHITRNRVHAVIRPASQAQVRACVLIARRWRLPLYPISLGKNWGYGSRAPTLDRAVALDLSRLKRIIEFNSELSYVVIEPGVSFEKLHRFLSKRRARLIAPAIGSTPKASVIGNALERGLGFGSSGERCASLGNLTVVLGSGSVIQTGFGSYPGALAQHVYRWGLGPSLDGLFFQSNLGVVTRATVWLKRLPKFFCRIGFRFPSRHLGRAIAALRRLRGQQHFSQVLFKVTNEYANAAATYLYWAETTRKARLPRPMPLRQRYWSGSIPVYGESKEEVESHAAEVTRSLRSSVELIGQARQARLAQLDLDDPCLGGQPSSPAWACYLHMGPDLPSSPAPDRDACGVLFCAPAVPLTAREVMATARVLREIPLQHRFEPCITINVLDERSACLVCGIYFDRREAEADLEAETCWRELHRALNKLGAFPHRFGVLSMEERPKQSREVRAVLDRLKEILDPDRILAPGRYAPSARLPNRS